MTSQPPEFESEEEFEERLPARTAALVAALSALDEQGWADLHHLAEQSMALTTLDMRGVTHIVSRIQRYLEIPDDVARNALFKFGDDETDWLAEAAPEVQLAYRRFSKLYLDHFEDLNAVVAQGGKDWKSVMITPVSEPFFEPRLRVQAHLIDGTTPEFVTSLPGYIRFIRSLTRRLGEVERAATSDQVSDMVEALGEVSTTAVQLAQHLQAKFAPEDAETSEAGSQAES